MKKNLLVLVMVLLGFSGMAQDRPMRGPEGGGGDGGMNIKQLTKELKLSADQKSKIEAIQAESAKATEALKAKMEDGGDKKAIRQEMKASREQTAVKIKAVLNDEQKVKYDELQEKRKENAQDRGGQGRGGEGKPNRGTL